MQNKWHIAIITILVFCAVGWSAPLRQSTATTIVIGPFVDWGNGKIVLREDADFDPTDVVCEIVKGATSSTLTLTKTGGTNNLILTGNGQATLTLTSEDTNTLGSLRICIANKLYSGISTEVILPIIEYFTVYPAEVYDAFFGSGNLTTDVSSSSQSTIRSGLATSAEVTALQSDVSGLATPAQVRSSVDDSIEFYNLDHLLKNGGYLNDIIVDQSIMAWLMAIDGDISRFTNTTDSQEAVRDKIDTIPTKPSRPSF